jgi:hypothetical protein
LYPYARGRLLPALLVIDAGIEEYPVAGARGIDGPLNGAVVRPG